MDTVIQSLSQSAIVQKLSDTENNVKRFTHDIPDNAPYRSFDKSEVQAYTGNRTDPDATLRFKIPRRGYLNRMYLKVSCIFDRVPDGVEADFGERPKGPEFFASFFTSAELHVGGKHVETLYAENILYDAFRNDKGTSENQLYWMKGSDTGYDDEQLGERRFGLDYNVSTLSLPKGPNFILPLNFSLFSFYKDSPDTTFLPKMEVVFNKRRMLGYQDGPDVTESTSATLVCKYHNVLNHFKTQIRNTNYPKETATLLTSNNYLVDTLPKQTQVAAVAKQSNPYIPGSPAYGKFEYKLDLDMYATDILITFRKLTLETRTHYISEVYCTPPTGHSNDIYLKFTLRANGRVLFERNHWEMHREDNVSSSDIQDSPNMSQGHTWYNRAHTENETIAGTLYRSEADTTEYRSAPCMYRIPLSLFGTDEFLNGGLDMKSLKNVELIIEGEALKPETTTKAADGLTPQIVIRHKTLTRIDGKTGAVSLV
jgi:hypothetical protein